VLQILVHDVSGAVDENPSSPAHTDSVDRQPLVMINFSCYYPNKLPPVVSTSLSSQCNLIPYCHFWHRLTKVANARNIDKY